MGNSFEKVFIGNAGTATSSLDITDVFSTFLYTGNASSQTITNGLDLSTDGGLVWVKRRDGTGSHALMDTERGTNRLLSSDTSDVQALTSCVPAFNNDGFDLGSSGLVNEGAWTYTSWTFRKAPKFFDVVTYTGSGSAKTVAHSLGSAPGMIIIKNTGVSDPWAVYHRANTAAPQTDYLVLNTTAATVDSAAWWNDTAPTSSVFTVGTDHSVNANGENYVAYLFAHNNSDGEFGPDSDQDIIKCGSYTGNQDAVGPVIDLGFEPQWLLIKNASSAIRPWLIIDVMRGTVVGTANAGADNYLEANSSAAEQVDYYLSINATGFQPRDTGGNINAYGETYIYMAVRRGPLAPPEAASEVFAVDNTGVNATTSTAVFSSGFPVDLGIRKRRDGGTNGDTFLGTRLLGSTFLAASTIEAETANGLFKASGFQDGFGNYNGSGVSAVGWMWKRAPGYFDVVCYTGTGSARTIAHNLGVVPEMIWIKKRDAERAWKIYHSGTGNGKAFEFNTEVAATSAAFWNNTTPTASVFSVKNTDTVNGNNNTFVAYLFATLAGISKVGSVSHSGTTNVDCGFSNGARFVLLKRTDAASDWYVWDSVRGIVAGNDPSLLLNTGVAEVTNTDFIDPLNAGFTISDNFTDGDYIFYAIA